jgi:OOP family OmpA-OmpF porin
MKTTFSRKQLGLAAACALALGIMSGAASADTMAPADQRAVVSGPVGLVWMDGSGNCLHSDFGPPPLPNTPCGPQPVAQYVAPAPAPAPVAQAAPAPAPVAAPQPVVEKVSLSADALFDFDKAVLRPKGRDALDAFMGKFQGADLQTISVVGHTDRLGSHKYNQHLSEQRAAAVKDYLVAKGIEPGNVRTEGVGETQPVTTAGECTGGKRNTVIKCLQPDRRVEIEVIGNRTAQ